jgi:hypothetical protein
MVNGNEVVGLLSLPRRNLGREKVLFFLQTKKIGLQILEQGLTRYTAFDRLDSRTHPPTQSLIQAR